MVDDLATDDQEPSPSAAYWLVRQTRERFMSLDYPKPPFPAQQQAINARLVRDHPPDGYESAHRNVLLAGRLLLLH